MTIPEKRIFLPVSRSVPVQVFRTTTRSPSAMMSSIVTRMSGTRLSAPPTYCLAPSGPGGRPGGRTGFADNTADDDFGQAAADVALSAAGRFIGRAVSRRVQRTYSERVLPTLAARQEAVLREQIAIAERHPGLCACLSDQVIFLAGGNRVVPMASVSIGTLTLAQSDALVAQLVRP